MKQYFGLILLVKCLILSSAEVSVDELHHSPAKIISVTATSNNIVASSTDNFGYNEKISPLIKEIQFNKDEETDYNEIADGIISSVAEEIFSGGLDPAELMDQLVTFEYKPLLITYTGTLDLTHGYIQDLSLITRNGEVLVTYSLNTNTYKIEVPLGFNYIIADYNFEMNVRGDTVSGVLYAWAGNVTAEYVIELSGSTMLPTSTDFAINIGSFTIDLYSTDFDSYESLLNELVADLMRDLVVSQTVSIVGDLLDEASQSVFVPV